MAAFAADAESTRSFNGTYIATAYSVPGKTASGEHTHRHIVAADPALLPIGTRLNIKRAGRYSGEYVVADTGEKIEGRKLDIYVPSSRACRKFGKKRVKVKVLEWGDGTREAVKQADQAVKAKVAEEVSKNAVGGAATEDDWAAKKAAEKKAAAASKATGTASTSTAPPNPR